MKRTGGRMAKLCMGIEIEGLDRHLWEIEWDKLDCLSATFGLLALHCAGYPLHNVRNHITSLNVYIVMNLNI